MASQQPNNRSEPDNDEIETFELRKTDAAGVQEATARAINEAREAIAKMLPLLGDTPSPRRKRTVKTDKIDNAISDTEGVRHDVANSTAIVRAGISSLMTVAEMDDNFLAGALSVLVNNPRAKDIATYTATDPEGLAIRREAASNWIGFARNRLYPAEYFQRTQDEPSATAMAIQALQCTLIAALSLLGLTADSKEAGEQFAKPALARSAKQNQTLAEGRRTAKANRKRRAEQNLRNLHTYIDALLTTGSQPGWKWTPKDATHHIHDERKNFGYAKSRVEAEFKKRRAHYKRQAKN